MERDIRQLILNYKEIKQRRVRDTKIEVTAEEERKYDNLRLQVIKNRINHSHIKPDEAITSFNGLNTELDSLLYTTTMVEHESTAIFRLGYKLVNEVYVRK